MTQTLGTEYVMEPVLSDATYIYVTWEQFHVHREQLYAEGFKCISWTVSETRVFAKYERMIPDHIIISCKVGP